MSSNAVGSERVSAVVGYKVKGANFSESSPNLPQRYAILGEANTANQSGVTFDEPYQITSAQAAGAKFGYGSPIHMMARILFPVNGGGLVGGIPVYVYPQEEPGSAAARVQTITVTGTATANGTHYVKVAGRTSLDGQLYAVNIVTGDTATAMATKIAAAINNVLGCPVSATSALGVVTTTTRWKGLTSQDVTIEMDTNNTSLGATYVVAQTTAGSGTPSISTALTNFGNDWNTLVINGYNTTTAILDSLEDYNGIPDPTTPTGRYSALITKPFIAITGSVADDPSSITDARKDEVTIAIAPAPASPAMPFEAAANMAALVGRCFQDTPHLDVSESYYPDMPVPSDGNIGSMASYDSRDSFVKKGCSTVDYRNGKYLVKDFVTTYHPVGELPPQYRYCRNLNIDWNMRFGYYLLEQTYVVGHVIADDADTVTATNVVKPKSWKQVLNSYADDAARRALIAEPDFMKESIEVEISSTNPSRLETFFRYKRTEMARISSTTAEAGFNFGTA